MRNFLETEIIGEISIDYFLGRARNYRNNGAKGEIELTGNAYNVSIKGSNVVIERGLGSKIIKFNDKLLICRIKIDTKNSVKFPSKNSVKYCAFLPSI